MGIIKYIKDKFNLNKKDTTYLKMTSDELKEIDDDELFMVILMRCEDKFNQFADLNVGITFLNEKQRIFYSLYLFECEVNNGGLCQFFSNSSCFLAPLVSKYMEIIGANEHKNLYDRFIKKHNLDVSNLTSFGSNTSDDFLSHYEQYPFDEYDDAFYAMNPLHEYLINYVKKNISYF